MRSHSIRLVSILLVLTALVPATAVARSSVNPQACLGPQRVVHASSSTIVKAVTGLTVDQKRALEARIAVAEPGHVPDMSGLGLTAAQQAQVVAAIKAHYRAPAPAGSPCAAFVNPAKVAAWTRATLVANAYVDIVITRTPREIQFSARTQESGGVAVGGAVVKTGTKTVAFMIEPSTELTGRVYPFTLPFVV